MIIASQNLSNYNIPVPKDTVLRINLAWCNSIDELENILKTHQDNKIFVDLPIGRIKPPNNRYTLEEIVPLFENYQNIEYFAISNVENDTDLDVFLDSIPKNVTIVPKIESPKGVKNIEAIMKKLDYEERIVMLDHDDLFSNIKKENEDPSNFQKYIKILIEKCRENNVNLLRTIGVVFGTEEKRTTDYVK